MTAGEQEPMRGKLLQRVTREISALGSRDTEVAARAEHRLCRSAARFRRAGGRVIERLVEATGDPNPLVRSRALWVLAATRTPSAYAVVLALTRDPDAAVRYDAAMALGKFGYVEAIEPLIHLMRQGESEDSLEDAAAMALVRLGRPAVLPVIALLQDEVPRVRRMAVAVLGGPRDKRAIEPLASLIRDPDQCVRRAVIEALEEIGDPTNPDEPRPSKGSGDLRCVDRCLDLIAACVDDPDEWIRLQAAFWRRRGYGNPGDLATHVEGSGCMVY